MAQKIKLFLMLILGLVLSSCHGDRTCESLSQIEIKPDLEKIVSVEEIINGYSIKHTDKNGHFQSCCVYLNGSHLDYNPERINKDSIRIKLQSIKSNDTLKLYYVNTSFWAKARIFRKNSDIKFIRLTVEKTPCDSITNIFYKHVTEKIDSVYTKENIEIVQLFDIVLQDKIEQYISTLPKYKKDILEECQKNFFILNYFDKKGEFGFKDNMYDLESDLRKFLEFIAITITEVVSEQNWSEKQFIVYCIGYADVRRYKGTDSIIDKSKLENDLGVTISKKITYAYGKPEPEELHNPKYEELQRVTDNNRLSVMRGFVSATYLEKKLKESVPNINFIFMYEGGGVISNGSYNENRKVDISIKIQGIKQQYSNIK